MVTMSPSSLAALSTVRAEKPPSAPIFLQFLAGSRPHFRRSCNISSDHRLHMGQVARQVQRPLLFAFEDMSHADDAVQIGPGRFQARADDVAGAVLARQD